MTTVSSILNIVQNSAGKSTTKYPARIIIVIIPKENRQLWNFANTVKPPVEFRKISKFYRKFDIAEIQMAKFLLPKFRFTKNNTVIIAFTSYSPYLFSPFYTDTDETATQ